MACPGIPATLLSTGLSSPFACHAAGRGRTWGPCHLRLAGRVTSRSRSAALCLAGKGSDDRLADCDEVCARPLDTDALAADAGAFEQQRQGISEQIGLGNSGLATEVRQAVAL